MKAMPPLTSHVPIQKNLSFPRPDSGYITVVRNHGHQLYRVQRHCLNLLKPNDIYIYIYICPAAVTSRRYILNIYSTNIHTEYFKHAA